MPSARVASWLSVTTKGLLVAIVALVMVACAVQDSESPTPVETAVGEPLATAIALPSATPLPAATEAAPVTIVPEATQAPIEPLAGEATDSPTAAPQDTPTPAVVEAQVSQINLALVAGGFTRPLFLTHAFDERLFVVEQAGQVKIVVNGQVSVEPFLDLRDRVGSSALEQGLLSIAFHPQYKQNGRLFVDYTDLQGNTVVAEYSVDPTDPDRIDPGSERILLTIAQPYVNHNGGQLQFGPDGYLYVGMGDGGSAGDPLSNGQNMGTLLGALLRLDVDNPDPAGLLPYGIPADNPLVGVEGARAEIWAYGLRNPWRFSFDRHLGHLYVADVGQSLWEEINFQAAGSPGGTNYGWNVMEASSCYGAAACDASEFTLPVAEYAHQEGKCSIAGGYVYRGDSFPTLSGNYFFADYCSGTIWTLFRSDNGSWQLMELQRTGLVTSSFGEDWRGELYLIDYIKGDIYQLQP